MLQALRAAVILNPDDLHSLHVYADALLERGDPAGELVRASAATNTPLEAGPEQFHLAGRLASAITAMTIYRGMPCSVSLKRLTPTLFARLIGRREWQTVRSIHFERGRNTGPQSVEEIVSLLTSPMMRNLRDISGLDGHALSRIGHQPVVLQIESASLNGYDAELPMTPLSALPALKRLVLSDLARRNVVFLAQSEVMKQLTSLSVTGVAYDLTTVQTAEVLLESAETLEHFTVRGWSGTRSERGWSVSITAHGADFYEVLAALERQGPRFHQVTLSTPTLSHALRAGLTSLGALFQWQLQFEERSEPEPFEAGDIPF